MEDVKVTTHGDFQVATARGVDEFVAWGKMGRIQTDCPVNEPGLVFFSFGATRFEAQRRILEGLGLA